MSGGERLNFNDGEAGALRFKCHVHPGGAEVCERGIQQFGLAREGGEVGEVGTCERPLQAVRP